MKKQINPTVKAYLIRSAFYLLLLVAVCAIPFALAQRNAARQSTQLQKAPAQSQPLTAAAAEGALHGSVVALRPSQPLAPAPMEDPWHGSPVVRIVPDWFSPGPYRLPGFEYAKLVPRSLLPAVNALINNNTGSTGTTQFTQSETSVLSFGSTIVVGFNDAGSLAAGNHFTGWSRSTDGGASWTDGGTLPATTDGDLGDSGAGA